MTTEAATTQLNKLEQVAHKADEQVRIGKRFGLPEELEADQVADALELAASEIRRGGSHEGFLLDAIDAERGKHSHVLRLLSGRGEGG